MVNKNREIEWGIRFLVFIYLILTGLEVEEGVRQAFWGVSAFYFFLITVATFRGFERANFLFDSLIVPVAILIGKTEAGVLSLLPLVVVNSYRGILQAGLILTVSVFCSVVIFEGSSLKLFSFLLLLVTTSLTSLVADYREEIRKKDKRISELEKEVKELLKTYAKWETGRKKLENVSFILNALIESEDVREFLEKVKSKFPLKSVRLAPKSGSTDLEPVFDRENGVLSVPVPLEEGYAVVIFELENPFQLSDPLLVDSLLKVAYAVPLFVAGFSDSSKVGRVISIS